jgi:hypothetical protein
MKLEFRFGLAFLTLLLFAVLAWSEVLDSPVVKAKTSNSENNAAQATCEVDLPKNATVIDVKAFAREIGGPWYECIGGGNGHDCGGFAGSTNPIGWASFKGTYNVNAPGNAVIVTWVFSNWSGNKEREAKIQVQYKLGK